MCTDNNCSPLPQSGGDYRELYKRHLNESQLKDRCRENLPFDNYSQPCYDATWTLAFALNETINGMLISSFFSYTIIIVSPYMIFETEDSQLGITLGLHNFTYDDNSLRDTLFQHLNRTDFKGLAVSGTGFHNNF